MEPEYVDGETLRRLGDRLDPSLRQFIVRSAELGFLGGMPVDDQIDHSLGFAALIETRLGGPPRNGVVDLGTGGGVPGLVRAGCWADTRMVLIDASERRTRFLQEVIEAWSGGGSTVVVRGRAEELGHRAELRECFDAVTSRSFGSPAVTAECGSAFVTLDGLMVVSEPPDGDPTERWPSRGVAMVGLVKEAVARPDDRFGYQILRKCGPLDVRFPRRTGVPAKRPLF